MPYISAEDKKAVNSGRAAIKPGELNYKISQLIKSYIVMNGKSYTTFNAIAGVLSCLSMEVYRRITAKYEDEKMSENGDVF
jgi:hypothetical protein